MYLELSCVQAWRQFKQRLWLLWSAWWNIKKKNLEVSEKISVSGLISNIWGLDSWAVAVCLDWEPCVNSFGFQRMQDFLFSVKTPCVGFVCSSSGTPPSSLEWPAVFPAGLYLEYLSCLTALGMCAIPVIPSSKLVSGLSLMISIDKNILILLYVAM